MRLVDDCLVIPLKLLVFLLGFQAMESENDFIFIILLVENQLESGQGHIILHTLGALIRFVNTHHLPHIVVPTHTLAYQRGIIVATVQQLLGMRCRQHDGFPLLLHIQWIDKAPLQNLYFIYLQ